eukprot:jgi/Undpi1/3644/HiC_scaffold_16.g07014.m1
MLKVGASLAVVWYVTQWSYIASLASTSVTSSTIIANSSVLFTYMFNVIAKTEQFNYAKTFGVVLAMVGAVAVGLSDKETDSTNESLWGDAASLASAVGVSPPAQPLPSIPRMAWLEGGLGLTIILVYLLKGAWGRAEGFRGRY